MTPPMAPCVALKSTKFVTYSLSANELAIYSVVATTEPGVSQAQSRFTVGAK